MIRLIKVCPAFNKPNILCCLLKKHGPKYQCMHWLTRPSSPDSAEVTARSFPFASNALISMPKWLSGCLSHNCNSCFMLMCCQEFVRAFTVNFLGSYSWVVAPFRQRPQVRYLDEDCGWLLSWSEVNPEQGLEDAFRHNLWAQWEHATLWHSLKMGDGLSCNVLNLLRPCTPFSPYILRKWNVQKNVFRPGGPLPCRV